MVDIYKQLILLLAGKNCQLNDRYGSVASQCHKVNPDIIALFEKAKAVKNV
jgi:hypothetical protein